MGILKQWFCRHKLGYRYDLYLLGKVDSINHCIKCNKDLTSEIIKYRKKHNKKTAKNLEILKEKLKDIKLQDLHEADFDERFTIIYKVSHDPF